jgi:hypothetical protein
MAERLSNADAIFRDTLTGNIQSLCDVLKSLNITEDPELEAMRIRIDEKLTGYNPDSLRKGRNIRMEVAKEAQDILSHIEALGKRKLMI